MDDRDYLVKKKIWKENDWQCSFMQSVTDPSCPEKKKHVRAENRFQCNYAKTISVNPPVSVYCSITQMHPKLKVSASTIADKAVGKLKENTETLVNYLKKKKK